MSRFFSGGQIVKSLKRAGFFVVSQKGSHVKLRGLWKEKLQTVIVPLHREVAGGTFQSILRQAEMTLLEFENFVK